MTKSILLGPPKYEELMSAAVRTLEHAGYACIPNTSGATLTNADIAKRADDCIAVIAGSETWGPAQLDLLPQLRIIAKCGVGLDTVDLAAAEDRGIVVTNTPGANSNAVAELAVGLMLSALRGIVPAGNAMLSGDRIHVIGRELSYRSVGLVGWGNVARLVARRLRGFDVDVRVFDPYVTAGATDDVQFVSTMEELITGNDIISLHAPLTATTRRLIDAKMLACFRSDAVLINTARGGLVDEIALANALDQRLLAGAALDVQNDERDGAANVLAGRPNVILLPHLGAESEEAFAAVGAANAADILSTIAGEPSPRRVLAPPSPA